MKINYFHKGYRSCLNIDHLRFGIEDYQLVKLACKLAETLNTDVAIGDAMDNKGFTYLIINPDRNYQKAYESSDDEENIKFAPYTEKAHINEYLEVLNNKNKFSRL